MMSNYMVKGYTFRENQLCHFHISSLFNGNQLIKGITIATEANSSLYDYTPFMGTRVFSYRTQFAPKGANSDLE